MNEIGSVTRETVATCTASHCGERLRPHSRSCRCCLPRSYPSMRCPNRPPAGRGWATNPNLFCRHRSPATSFRWTVKLRLRSQLSGRVAKQRGRRIHHAHHETRLMAAGMSASVCFSSSARRFIISSVIACGLRSGSGLATEPYWRPAMTTAVDNWPAFARLLAVAQAGPVTYSSYTTPRDTTP
jgi:hypothetical protein